jgi:hypothetical protein
MDFKNDSVRFEAPADAFSSEQLLAAQAEIAHVLAERGVEVPVAIGATSFKGVVEQSPEPTPSPLELDDYTVERLVKLPESLRELTFARYTQRARFTDTYLKEGILPEGYELPKLAEFIDRIGSLVPTFEHMTAKGMTPSIEFVLLGLNDSRWNEMFCQYETTRNGTFRSFEERNLHDSTVYSALLQDTLWDVVVVDASERPTVIGISKDGKNGSNRRSALETLRALPTVDASAYNESVIAQAAVTEAAYRTLQLSRVERGETPVDAQTWTLVRENAIVADVLRVILTFFDRNDCQVKSTWYKRDINNDNVGLRVGVSGTEILAQLIVKNKLPTDS